MGRSAEGPVELTGPFVHPQGRREQRAAVTEVMTVTVITAGARDEHGEPASRSRSRQRRRRARLADHKSVLPRMVALVNGVQFVVATM